VFSPLSKIKFLLPAIVVALLVWGVSNATAAFTAHSGQRVDLKVLLLTADGTEPAFAAWKAQFKREGVPYEAIIGTASGRPTLTAAKFAAGNHAFYQGVVVATADGTSGGRPISFATGTGVTPFSAAEWSALQTFESTFAIRQLVANAYPGPALGLNYATQTGAIDGTTANLTAAGLQTFRYLVGPVKFDSGTFGASATPCAPAEATCSAASFETLLTGSAGSALLGIATTKDEREEMIATFDGNENQLHTAELRHGMLNWVTRGIYLGRERNYFAMQVDDVFLPNDGWDTATNTTPENENIRMTAADVTRLINFQNSNAIKLDMAFNGEGSVAAGSADPLTSAFLANRSQFRWINHTYAHLNLDAPNLAAIKAQIQDNITWASAHGVSINATELVTGDHSGLANPAMAQALTDTGIRSIAADNSKQPSQYGIGPALTFPRFPTNVFYNAQFRDQQLDEYNYVYLPPPAGACVNTATTTCLTAPATWDQYVDREATIILQHMVGNDPRPHFAHQSNLAGDGILYSVVGESLARYRTYFKPPPVQLTSTEIVAELRRQNAWADALAAGKITGYVEDGKVTLLSTAASAVELPITGTTTGTLYGDQMSGWMTLGAGATVTLSPSDPRNTAAPSISGTVRDGSTLTANTGTWSATPTIGYSYQWQRRLGTAAWTDINAATAKTYQVVPADIGRSLRVVVGAANRISSWSLALSGASAGVTAVPPANAAAPAISGNTTVGSTLTTSNGTWTGTSPITYTYQWERTSTLLIISLGWRTISGQTSPTHVVTSADRGERLRVLVKATNAAGSTSVYTAAVGPAR
jgi:hypothetical protein